MRLRIYTILLKEKKNMDNSVYRKPEEPVAKPQSQPVKIGDKAGTQDVKVEVPYTEYEKENNQPYMVEHFKLGDSWKDKLGGFEKEVGLIEDYFKGQIEQGKLKNEIGAVKEKLSKIFKLCNIDKTERATMQIEKLTAYLEFLKKTENIDLNNYKYR